MEPARRCRLAGECGAMTIKRMIFWLYVAAIILLWGVALAVRL